MRLLEVPFIHYLLLLEDIMSHTVSFHRVLRATPEKVYRALLDPQAMVKWSPPHGFVGEVSLSDVRVGGQYKMSFTNFTSQEAHSFGGTYLELIPHQRIVYNDQFDDPKMPGVMITTIDLKPVSCGVAINISQSGIPTMIPPEMCYLGWQESLQLLALLVEAQVSTDQ
jgi:uncharacterized protein YndB with AHSA1/START domain